MRSAPPRIPSKVASQAFRSSLVRSVTAAFLASVAFVVTPACNSVLGIPEVERRADAGGAPLGPESGAPACGAGQKACGGVCVSAADSSPGCVESACGACALPHATSSCVDGACVVQMCDEGYADCNATRVDGCEADLRADPNNCAKCGESCGSLGCVQGVCACTSDESCKFGGVCNRGRCDCGADRCAQGVVCDFEGYCSE